MLYAYAGTTQILSDSEQKEIYLNMYPIGYTTFTTRVATPEIATIFPEYNWPELGLCSGFSRQIQDDWTTDFFQSCREENVIFIIRQHGIDHIFENID